MRHVLLSRAVSKLASLASQVLVGVLVALVAAAFLNSPHAPARSVGEPSAKFSMRVPDASNAGAAQSTPPSAIPVATFALIQPPLSPPDRAIEKKADPTAVVLHAHEIAKMSPPPRPKTLGTVSNTPPENRAVVTLPTPDGRRVGLLEAIALPPTVLDFNRLSPSAETIASAAGVLKSAFDWVSGDASR